MTNERSLPKIWNIGFLVLGFKRTCRCVLGFWIFFHFFTFGFHFSVFFSFFGGRFTLAWNLYFLPFVWYNNGKGKVVSKYFFEIKKGTTGRSKKFGVSNFWFLIFAISLFSQNQIKKYQIYIVLWYNTKIKNNFWFLIFAISLFSQNQIKKYQIYIVLWYNTKIKNNFWFLIFARPFLINTSKGMSTTKDGQRAPEKLKVRKKMATLTRKLTNPNLKIHHIENPLQNSSKKQQP